MKKTIFAAALLGMAVMSQPALAHKVLMDLYTESETIEGEVGFSNGDMAKDSKIEVYDDKGNLLGTTMTNDEGVFVYKPTKRVPHVFRANLGAGHIIEKKVAVEDLPEDLVEGGSAAATPTANAPAAKESVDATALRKMISKEVNRAVKPLRKDIIAMREQKELHSILGGIGYILGICGVAAFFMSRRKNAA